MKSFQSPEGCSTYKFPKIFGVRLANDILLCDKIVDAKLAQSKGFVNDILSTDLLADDFFDPNEIPVVSTLLKSDYKTILNCKKQLNASKDLPRLHEVLQTENKALLACYLDEDFPPKMMKYMMYVSKKLVNKDAKM